MTSRLRRAAIGLVSLSLLPVLAATPVAAAGAVITVTSAEDGDSSDATCTLREAIEAADLAMPTGGCTPGTAGADTIVFAPAITSLVLGSVLPDVDSAVTIDGGGTVTFDAAGNQGLYGAFGVYDGANLTLKGLDLKGSTANMVFVNATGALTVIDSTIHDTTGGSAIYSNGGTVTLTRVAFARTATSSSGGSLFNAGGTATITASTFDSASAAGQGGAIYAGGAGTTTITSSTFTANSATSGGGAVFVASGTLHVDGSAFTGNTTDVGGAGISATGTTTITNSTFQLNVGVGQGGGAQLGTGTHTVDRVVFAQNTAGSGSGLYNAGALTLTRSTFSDNLAAVGGFGGGLYQAGSGSVTATTFEGNSAEDGGAVYHHAAGTTYANVTLTNNAGNGGAMELAAATTISNATIVGNTGTNNTGALWASGATGPLVRNSIIAGNAGGAGSGADWAGGSANNYATDASLSTWLDLTLRDNGGPTQTLRLKRVANNPLIDSGSSVVCAASPVSALDQRGVVRPTACDLGAFELESTAPKISSTPKPSLRTGVALSSTSSRADIKWVATDTGGSGVATYAVQRSVNGGSYVTVATGLTTPRYGATIGNGTSYRFRVRATDHDGNVSAWTAGPTFKGALVQQSSATFGGSWTASSSSSFSGGSAKYAKVAGASARYTFTGRAVSFVTTKGPGRGAARIYIDGALKATIDLYQASVTTYRVQAYSFAWSSSGTHSIRVVVVGTPGRARVDVDAFAVLK